MRPHSENAPGLVASQAHKARTALGVERGAGLPRVYSPELYQRKCSAIFEHVFESYPERDAGVYSAA